ncbi:hypothetical protein NQ317_013531 [Molorchus minor]|uniref:Ciliogenesis-associated TTC17-interacting protein N-terminal domain-containing protein n=1 Tax=Molorchus minor TaxID=1323400 RepID=A0ABQ9JWC6_9CUCU|nr:hypothetical protein NQ317_013531 [Molorchus minor]
MFSQSLEDAILTYLKQQEGIPEGFDFLEQVYEIEADIKDILNDLLLKVNKRIACKDRYDNLTEWHNQYPLFDLNDYIPGFCIDEEIFQQIAFREMLLISELNMGSDTKLCKPKPVGGLCIDIQTVEGHLPIVREQPVDAELDREIFGILQRVKREAVTRPRVDTDKLEERLQEKLAEYEQFLRNAMKQNVRKFVVHVSSHFDINGFNAGSRITAWVDRYFHTLEEKRTEFINLPNDQLNQKSLYVALQNHKYYLRHESTFEKFEERKYYGLNKTKELLCEGANFLLMRYLAVIEIPGLL